MVHNPWKMHPLYVLLGTPMLLQLVNHHPQRTKPTSSEGGVIPIQKGPKEVQLKMGPAG